MSEAIEGIPPAPPPKPPRDASAAIVFRQREHGVEVFWLERERRLSFAGGFFAFPGGKVDPADSQLPVANAQGNDATLIVTAARELFEETGLLISRGPPLAQSTLESMRRALLAEDSFATLLRDAGHSLDAADFPSAGRWLTPPYLQVRFDARFFLVEAPDSQAAVVWPGELAAGEWIRPEEALRRWEAGSALLHPPNLHVLRVLRDFESTERALEALRAPPFCEGHIARHLEFQRGVHVVPLETPTLPPATHTNAYVLGTGQLLIVDPGASDEAEWRKLETVVRELMAKGATPLAIVLTHHHGDHTGGVAGLSSALQVPVWAHEKTAERIRVPVARRLKDGDVIELSGPLPMRWKVAHTPGHAVGHLCFIDERSKAGIVGDMVSTVSTIVIDPPEGDMGEYLRQLERLREWPVGSLYPAHGPVVAHGVAKLEEYLAHRAWREAKVLEALRSFTVPATLEDVVPKAYDDVAAFVWPLAERNTIAILKKLETEQRVIVSGDTFRAA